MAGEEKVLQVVWLIIGNNHPVGLDGGIEHVPHIGQGGLVAWGFQESITEDLLEMLGQGIFRIERQMLEDFFSLTSMSGVRVGSPAARLIAL
jgi:hypothetical protein